MSLATVFRLKTTPHEIVLKVQSGLPVVEILTCFWLTVPDAKV